MRSPVGLLALLATGCTWLGRNQLDERLAEIDEDGDGFSIAQGDCAPLDPGRSPGLAEIPYDRVDNDCDPDGTDLFDVDQDGFAGISKADYEALPGDIPYPDQYLDEGGEQIPVDCNDADKGVYPEPTRAIEHFYDGVDQDCQEDNDYDLDGDGYYPDELPDGGGAVAPLIQAYIDEHGFSAQSGSWGPGGAGPAQGHDCEDSAADVNPGIVDDDWGDGVDSNCDDHNDYDEDGDGFMPPTAIDDYAFYVNKYYGTDTPPFDVDPVDPFGDCVDAVKSFANVPDIATAARVHPGATEVWYDSIDEDCAGDNDFDADGDGYVPDGEGTPDTLTAMNDYATAWSYAVDAWAPPGFTSPQGNDCDDALDTVHPNALEHLGGADEDCNLDPDLSTWGGDDNTGTPLYDWHYPTNPEIARVGDDFLVIVGATEFRLHNGAEWIPDYGPSLLFHLDNAVGGSVPNSHAGAVWKVAYQPLKVRNRIDIAMSAGAEDRDSDGITDEVIFVGLPTSNDTLNYTYLYLSRLQHFSATNTWRSEAKWAQVDAGANQLYTYVPTGFDVTSDLDGGPFLVACGTENAVGQPAEILHGTYWTPGATVINAAHLTTGGDTCFMMDQPAEIGPLSEAHVQSCVAGSNCTEGKISSVLAMTDLGTITPAESWGYGDNDDGLIALIDQTGHAFVRDTTQAAPDVPVLANAARLPTTVLRDPTDIGATLDVAKHGNDLYVAGILNNASNDVYLQYGNPTNPTYVNLHFDPVNARPSGISLYVDDDRVAIAVSTLSTTTSEDGVTWMFLGPP